MSRELLTLTALEMVQKFESRELSPVEVARAMLDQAGRLQTTVNAFCLIDEQTTLEHARAAENRYADGNPKGLVDGVPVGVKDVFYTPMWPTLRGSRVVDPKPSMGKDSPATRALERHGYVPLGKTTTPEFGWKGVTDSPLCGVTRNPWDPDKTPGGSSGGSGAAVALGMGPLALGTDAGGSIRIPAGFCGVVGFKPTFGEVPHWPASPFGNLAHGGPMAWTVADCALLMNVLTEADARDSQAAPWRQVDYLQTIEGGIEGLKVAFSPTLGYVDVNREVAEAVAAAARTLEALGAHVVETDPGFAEPLAAFGHLFYGGAANAMREIGPKKRAMMDPQLVSVAEKAARRSMLDYLEAGNERLALSERMALFHQRYDLLVTPTLPITAFDAGREVPEDWHSTRWPTWTPFSYPFNMSGQPALSVPCGFDSAGLPIGLQIVGGRFRDELVLRAGHAYQQAAPLTDRRPALFDRD